MRPIFWSRISTDDVDATVWCQLSDEKVELDIEMLYDLFPKKAKVPEGQDQQKEVKSEEKSKKAKDGKAGNDENV